ncbi:response regulator transcription factor [Roseomonas sp. HF4]|uniref:response regulator transcription factor n=1 Tax=Roseomonas sp. HF4 TaxID=2562313 RepID=UPI0010C100FF|nr:response regulator transcription factor [Roseomonas sp. HF4]
MPEAPDRSIAVPAPHATLSAAAQDLPRILVVEDDDAVGEELVDFLNAYRMRAHRVADWASAMGHLRGSRVDVVILDQWLGSLDSLTVLHEMRAITTAHILMLTGNNSEADRIVGLEVGADDFLHKPISGREMVARVRAHLRRAAPPRGATGASPTGQWRVDFALRQVFGADGRPVALTSTEYELLTLLMERPGHPVDRDTLSRAVLRRDYRCEDRALDNLVHNIRLKLGSRRGTGTIATVRNKGYAFTGFPSPR